MPTEQQNSGGLTVTLIGPDESRRKAVAAALADCNVGAMREFTSYPTNLEELPEMLAKHYDVILVDLDSDPEYALDVVEAIYGSGAAMVMVYSEKTDRELVVSSMRAGAREFLTLPIQADDLADALSRVSVRSPAAQRGKWTPRKLFVFVGTKGGCGVTTLSSNFAIALAQESGQKTLLIDLGQPLGDAAINLGIIAQYSVNSALEHFSRLDSSFLASLLTTHASGLSVLAAPGEFSRSQVTQEAIDKLIAVARTSFRYVVVDVGSSIEWIDSTVFEDASTVYLITQVGVSELRNANRMITRFFPLRGDQLQIVLNRYVAHALIFDEDHITKALTRPAQWKVPDDWATARRTRNTATALAMEDSAISKVLHQMARTAAGLPASSDKKKIFSFFG
jgi:pilus assembly protein CpaE